MNSVCKGAWVLGTACGLCARCKKTVHEYISCGTKWANQAAAIVRIINEDQKPNQGMNMKGAKEKILLESLKAIAAVENQMYGGDWDEIEHAREIANKALESFKCKFVVGDHVRKKSGSQWQGYVVGTYSTSLTPEGYAIESETHAGSVQIYPASALEYV